MSNIHKNSVIYEVLAFLDKKQQHELQMTSRLFYTKIIPTIIFKSSLKYIKRLIIVRGQNKLVFFYPSASQNHKFTNENELPFDKISADNIIDFQDKGFMIMLPFTLHGSLKDVYKYEDEFDGLITKMQSMNAPRFKSKFVKVWGSLIYAIGGRANGMCDRFDVNLNKWSTIAQYPNPYQILNSFVLNIGEKYLYLVNVDLSYKISLSQLYCDLGTQNFRLDLELQEREIDLPLNQQPQSKWVQMNLNFIANKIQFAFIHPSRESLIIFNNHSKGDGLNLNLHLEITNLATMNDPLIIGSGGWLQPQSYQFSVFGEQLYLTGQQGREVSTQKQSKIKDQLRIKPQTNVVYSKRSTVKCFKEAGQTTLNFLIYSIYQFVFRSPIFWVKNLKSLIH